MIQGFSTRAPLILLLIILLLESASGASFGQYSGLLPQAKKDKDNSKKQGPAASTGSDSAQDPDKVERKRQRRAEQAEIADNDRRKAENGGVTQKTGAPVIESLVEIVSGKQRKDGDVLTAEEYVDVTMGDVRLQADHVVYNSVTADMVAQGNVVFDQGPDQRVTARRAEINWSSRKGTFWETTGFTNRTETGEYVYFTAERVEKTGPGTYLLYKATVTACEDVVPKWVFRSARAELKVDDRLKMYKSAFRVKGVPILYFPFTWIPITKRERKSGFLLPSTGTSNQKGRTLKLAYYQTLGESADITFRGDVYTQRGIGMGAEFRAQTDEESYMRLGVFSVKDRLFGTPGEKQGGTAFVGEGVQHLPHGWLAVGNVSLVTSLAFRQVFSDDISQVINPRRESTFYATNNPGAASLSFLATNETTTLFQPGLGPSEGTNFDIKIRQAPALNLMGYPRSLFGRPIYFSFDSSVGALKREESVDGAAVFVTPSGVQRLDFQPKLTIPLATVAGVAITPSVSVRETFYTSRINPSVQLFDPSRFTLNPDDPRLNPAGSQYNPAFKLFDRTVLDAVLPQNISRLYTELAVDVRPPSLERDYLNPDGGRRFKHVIEPYFTYRLISGIGSEFGEIIKFDENDAVANTNEFEYAMVNRFFASKSAAEIGRKHRRKGLRQSTGMEPERPDRRGGKKKQAAKADRANPEDQPAEAGADEKAAHKPGDKAKLEKGQPDELTNQDKAKTTGRDAAQYDRNGRPKLDRKSEVQTGEQSLADDGAGKPADDDLVVQAYEFLTVKVAQKYFFDRDFGGALVEGRRNQFYPIDTLSGFTYGGHIRSFSPVNVAVRYRPLSTMFADLRMDIGTDAGPIRNVIVSGGVRNEKITVSASWYLSKRIELEPNRFEAGTFAGDQVFANFSIGNEYRGMYGGARLGYDFTDRFLSPTEISKGRPTNTRSYVGYAWDCCGLQFNYNTFKAGLRSESHFSFTFTLAGLGSYGTDQFSQLSGGGGRKKGKRRNQDEDF